MNDIEVKKAYNLLYDYCEEKKRSDCDRCILAHGSYCPINIMVAHKFDIHDENSHPIDNHITHPAHYTDGNIEVWDFIADKKLSFFSGNVIKYVCRAGKKDPDKRIEDLKKARAYIDKQIELWESDD